MKEQILEHLPPQHPWRDRVCWFPEMVSTNTEAKKLAQNGAAEGTVLIADAQTGGRGRMGRSFHSAPGVGVYLSVILRPECTPDKLMHLTCAVAVAMCKALEFATGYRPGIKWINDLIAQGKKLGGILTELSLNPATGLVDFAIVGIGINCNQDISAFPEELQQIATSLKAVLGQEVDRSRLMAAMIEALQEMAEGLLTEKTSIMAEYKRNCVTLRQNVYLIRGNSRFPCRALDLDSEGSLLVEYPDGSQEFVCSGEVSLRNL
ncbi:MAG: biotin--[acetyl-CoA-carboxylase] ligase [Oscillospiraceae bacterium]|nr:biotin--[acetyl-CoA-carboxylase] ligase [Oscillospiraceae bacterium]